MTDQGEQRQKRNPPGRVQLGRRKFEQPATCCLLTMFWVSQQGQVVTDHDHSVWVWSASFIQSRGVNFTESKRPSLASALYYQPGNSFVTWPGLSAWPVMMSDDDVNKMIMGKRRNQSDGVSQARVSWDGPIRWIMECLFVSNNFMIPVE